MPAASDPRHRDLVWAGRPTLRGRAMGSSRPRLAVNPVASDLRVRRDTPGAKRVGQGRPTLQVGGTRHVRQSRLTLGGRAMGASRPRLAERGGGG